MTPRRPAVVAFDVVETLFSLAPVGAALAPLGVDLDLFFARLLCDGFALSAAGGARRFADVAAATLAVLASAARRAEVLDAFSRLPAQPDAEPAMRRLSDAGVVVLALTNGGAASTRRLLAAAALDHHVRDVFSVDEVGAWKPARALYQAMDDAVGRPAEEEALVAVHGWDVHGARSAGLVTGWASRLEGALAVTFEPPDVVGADLVEVVDGLLALG